MPDPKTDAAPAQAPQPAPPVIELTLQEFCADASELGHGVELLGGFYAEATAKGLFKATRERFENAFDAFANRPV